MSDDKLREVIDLELETLSTEARLDATRMDQLLDDDFREIGASGRLWTRAEAIQALAEEGVGQAAIEVSDLQAQALDSCLVLVTYVSQRAGRRTRRSSLWRRSNLSWRLVFHQGTLA